MKFITILAVTFFAGMGAGLGTGFAGMSAAAVISPMLITFLGMDPYMAVGIALASDVLASAVSAYTYHKNKNLDVRNGLIMMAAVLLFTVVGSYIASLLPSHTMGGFSVFMTFLLGVKFIVRPVMTTKEAMQGVSVKKRAAQSVVCGVLIGFICGFVGAGGGMMMLLILTSVLGYELKTAVGTSVFIMTFTALTGAISHFTIGGAPDWTALALCMVFALCACGNSSAKSDDIHIGIVTGSVSQSEDDRCGAEAFQELYGKENVTLVTYPDNFTEELETTIQCIVIEDYIRNQRPVDAVI